jgi:hypothetical protein
MAANMPRKKAYYRKPGHLSRSQPAAGLQEGRGLGQYSGTRVQEVVVHDGVWGSINKAGAQALKKVVNLVSQAREDSVSSTPSVRLVIGMDRERRIPKFEIEGAGSEQGSSDDLDSALTEARERGVSRAVEILSRPEMFSAADFAKFIGVSREAVRAKHQRHEVLGLKGAKRGLRFPKWQVTSDGGLLPELPRLFEILDGDPWTVYRFLTQHHAELEGNTALSALLRGKVEKVLAAAENTAGAFSWTRGSPDASERIWIQQTRARVDQNRDQVVPAVFLALPWPAWVRFLIEPFSDPRIKSPEKDRFGVIYFGSSLKVCFLERVLRDLRNARLGDVPIPYTELEQLMCAEVTTVRPLNLVDLRDDCPVKMGVPIDAVRASSHRLGQKWSLAFWLHKQRPHGILYPSRLNEEINLALYDIAQNLRDLKAQNFWS